MALVLAASHGHIGHMRKTSLADAKAHLSELVDEAEHRGKRIVILRHGKPADPDAFKGVWRMREPEGGEGA